MKKILQWCKGQPVLCVAFLAALISACFVLPDQEYLGYCNTNVLFQLFSLMITVAGLRFSGIFTPFIKLLYRFGNSKRKMCFIFMNLCFFLSMLVTNDVALLTFVPLTLILLKEQKQSYQIHVIVTETAAANLGSMLTPIGNPQNLYLYDVFHLTTRDFLSTMWIPGVLSYLLLCVLCLLIKKEILLPPTEQENTPLQKRFVILFGLEFVICILTVFRVIPNLACLILCILIPLIFQRKLFRTVDYGLILTFICFFIFVGNLSRISVISEFLQEIITGKELLTGVVLSQIISNVPAAVMLSGFTSCGKELMLGTDIGGLGTPVASLASLISWQFYSKSEGTKKGRYLLVFSLVNFSFLAILLLVEFLL